MIDLRPGGGSSYSGGSHSSSSGGGGGGDGVGLFIDLIVLCLQYPVIGIPLVLVIIGYFAWKLRSSRGAGDWSSGGPSSSGPALVQREPPAWKTPPRTLAVIRAVDPRFSRIVFEDFLYSLYAEVHVARGANQLNRLSAYLSEQAARALQAMAHAPVEGVIVGSLQVVDATASIVAGCRLVVGIEANYTEGKRGWYVAERWVLERAANAPSREPKRARILGCPSCGAPQEALFAGTCKHCGKVVNDGSFDWTVQSITVLRREEKPPMLTSNVEEEGTDEPTLLDAGLPVAIAALRTKDPAFEIDPFKRRIGLVFEQFQLAWTGRNLAQMRPFMSDALFTTQQYWINAYLAQHLRNVTEGTQITNIQLAKVVSDPYFDAITVRLFAKGLDYVVDDSGKVLSGSKSRQRAYSEYWTLVRGTNRKGPTRTDLACPSCGAPLDINMVGDCKYCKAKVTTGDFDWVLSKIEQDEAYGG